MRGAALIAMILASSSASLPAEQPAPPADLVEFADRFDQAQLRKDGPALERMVADDLVFVTGEGKRLGKKEFIAGWTDPADRFDPITLVDRVVVPLGSNAGMVSAETVLSGMSGGKRFAGRFRFTDTFERVDGMWRVVHIQVTRIPQ